jgi:hypothetical protein
MPTTPATTASSPGHDLLISAALAIAVGLAWQTSAVVPFKILVVFFHEASHLLTALLTGGEVLEMRIVPQQGGSVVSRGGWPFLIASAGYLGSLLIGASLLLIASLTRADRIAMTVLALLTAWLTVRYMRGAYGWTFGLSTAAVMALLAWLAPHRVNDILLRTIGLISLAYVPLDIWSDTLARSYLMSDARILAMNYGGTTWLWGGLWIIISIIVVILTLRACLRHGLSGVNVRSGAHKP